MRNDFESNIYGVESRIKPDRVFKLADEETFENEDALENYPTMLPDFDKLDLKYAVTVDIPEKPEIWRKD